MAMATIQSSFLIGTLLVVAVVLFGEMLITGALGEKYLPLVPFLTLLAILSALRVFKAGGGVVALSCAKTGNQLISNLFRVAALPLAWVALVQGSGLATVIWIGVIAETLGLAASFLLLRHRVRLPLRPILPTFALGFWVLAVALLPDLFPQALPGWAEQTLLIASFGLMIYGLTDFRRYVMRRQLSKFDE